jgi:hypothetical protein
MRREDIYELEFCEPTEKAQKAQELAAIWERAEKETMTPLYILAPAIEKLYPEYRRQRLAREMPNVPPQIRRG